MKIALASAVAADAASAVRERLEEAGYDLQSGDDDTHANGAVVVLVSPTADAARLIPLWERAEVARTAQVPVIGASLGDPAGLPAAVSAIPHDGSWIELSANPEGISPLL